MPPVAPTADDPVVRGLSAAIGGPPGRHASAARTGAARFWTPLRVVLALAAVVLALAWVQKAPCRTAPWAHEYQYTHVCYTDVYALYFAEGLNQGKVPYLQHPVEYPVLTGALMALVAWPARALRLEDPAVAFFDLTALLLAACGLVTVWALARLHQRRPYDAALFAAAPILVVTGYVNWDLFAVALATGFLLAWARGRLVLAGVLLGLAVAAKFYPVLFLGPLFVLCWRAGRLQAYAVTTAAAAGTWLAVNLPVALAAPTAWRRFFVLSTTRGVDWGTFWYWLDKVRPGLLDVRTGPGGFPMRLNLLVALALLAACVAIAGLALHAPRRPRVAQLLFLTLAAFLLTGKVWSQQYVLWLLPLAVLARPRWRSLLAWQAAELAYFLAFYYELTGAARGAPVIPEGLFLLAAGLRAAALAGMCALVVRDILRPAGDPVRAAGDDDPAGGVLDGVPDHRRWVLTPSS